MPAWIWSTAIVACEVVLWAVRRVEGSKNKASSAMTHFFMESPDKILKAAIRTRRKCCYPD
jgi:hypothetical protein